MAKERRSLQDLIRSRQQSGFVGRQGQIVQYQENLGFPFDDERRRFLFNIHGDAGVGKTYLAKQLRQIAIDEGCLTAYIDETVDDAISAMTVIAEEFSRGGVRLRRVREARCRLPGAPPRTRSRPRTLPKASRHSSLRPRSRSAWPRPATYPSPGACWPRWMLPRPPTRSTGHGPTWHGSSAITPTYAACFYPRPTNSLRSLSPAWSARRQAGQSRCSSTLMRAPAHCSITGFAASTRQTTGVCRKPSSPLSPARSRSTPTCGGNISRLLPTFPWSRSVTPKRASSWPAEHLRREHDPGNPHPVGPLAHVAGNSRRVPARRRRRHR